jgi:peptide-methionine (S)-S-oxide reductase
MGGRAEQATYHLVCNGDTGHVEVVRVTFDPEQISYRELLDVFFAVHDPTTLNRQGNDAGEQYRSVIFYNEEEQRRTAEDAVAEMTAAKLFSQPIVTAIEPAGEFFAAEDYHRNYYNENSHQPYCMFTISPKLVKLEKKFGGRLRA